MHDTRWHNHDKYVLPKTFSVSIYHRNLSCVTSFMRNNTGILTQLIKLDLAGRGLDNPCAYTRFFSFTKLWSTPSHLFNRYEGLFPHVHEIDCSTQSKLDGQDSKELYFCSPPYLHSVYRHKFTFTLTTKCCNDDISFSQSLTNEPWPAVANKTIQFVHARCAILTRLRRTIIKCVLASLSCITRFTRTSEIIYAIFALSVILTWCTSTVVYIHITHCTCKWTISQENEVMLTLQLV